MQASTYKCIPLNDTGVKQFCVMKIGFIVVIVIVQKQCGFIIVRLCPIVI